MKEIDYRISAQIKGEAPDIQFEIKYKDEFTNDHYTFKSLISEEGTKRVPFMIFKNNKDFGKVVIEDRNVKACLDTFLESTEDMDFKNEFKKQIFEQVERELGNFFEFFDNAIILKSLTLEGEMKRMRVVAGIIKS